ncbi:PhoH family protein [Bacillus mexicanus]|uniref:PhoH family protein n=1 Tax=Bacillus mexicanus TaxID=2834415 RepID=UPI003D1901C1
MENYVLDTNVILNDASSIYKFGEANVIIPAVVLEEVNNKKGRPDIVGKNARDFSRFYMKLREQFTEKGLSNSVTLQNGGTFRVELNHNFNNDIQKIFGEMNNDNKILSVAINLALEDPNNNYKLVSNDSLMIAKADSLRLKLNDGLKNFDADVYDNDRLVENIESIHKGYHELFINDVLFNELYRNKNIRIEDFVEGVYKENDENILDKIGKEIFIGDFIVCKHPLSNQTFIGRLVIQEGKQIIRQINIDGPTSVKGIEPKNLGQKMFLDLLLDKETSLICCIGKAGTGKTLEALAAGLHQVEELSRYDNLLVARPIVEMGNGLGFLPGELEDKLRPWMQPIYDNLEYIYTKNSKNKASDKKDRKNTIEDRKNIDAIVAELPHLQIEALTYIRGRSIPNQFIIIDEAQNLTSHEVKTIITRAAEGTKIVLVGDPEQIDNKFIDSVSNGLTFVTERMKAEPYVGVIKLEKSERSALAERATELLK